MSDMFLFMKNLYRKCLAHIKAENVSLRKQWRATLLICSTISRPFMLPASEEQQTILVPTKRIKIVQSSANQSPEADYQDNEISIKNCPTHDDLQLSVVNVALMIRSKMVGAPGHSGLSVSEDDEINCSPDNLFMFLKLLYRGQDQLQDQDGSNDKKRVHGVKHKVLTAQDMIYGTSDGKKLTPKHIGLGSTLHHVTRLKELVCIFFTKQDTSWATSRFSNWIQVWQSAL